jgi:hypothetical protein
MKIILSSGRYVSLILDSFLYIKCIISLKISRMALMLHKEASEEQTERPKYDIVIENTGTFVLR